MMNKHILKRYFCGLLAGVLTLSLVGCSKEKTVELVDKPEQATIIRLYSGGGNFSDSNPAKYWSDNFQKETGIPAVIHYNEEGEYYAAAGQDSRTILRNRIESDQPDDMYIVQAEDMIEFARKGYILDLSDFDFVGNLSETARQLSTIDGKVYCLPLVYTGFGLYWNVDLLAEHGLEVPENYQELIAVWDALVDKGITPYAGNMDYGLSVPAMCLSLNAVYGSPDKDRLLADLTDGTTPISTYARKGFEFIALMRERGYVGPKTGEIKPKSEEEAALFQGGKAACVCSAGCTVLYNDPEATGFAVKMTGWPLLEDGYISVVGTSKKLCINPASKHLDVATAFVEMAGSEEALVWCTDTGKVSAGKVNDPAKYLETEKEFDELIQTPGQIPNTDMNLKLNLWEHVRDISRLVVTGEISVDDACRMLDEKQQQDIAANASSGS
ncbi:ABC transporter substrate-binding protein [Bittarella massiliensis (ex Durand et al. 2017)]|uniref:ABC transporter substrate-binding protein n=1 Tax=Bittarella massiliensis (ex Durand et al. 2017) TaxID=1720313 RepID=UPI001AA13BB1|nr:ABC transporter substrate-binding protein [Bittarella massiliensis (ex Durand et al. 2017)]MBO1678517.1 carbohydrate ABC transporter substrate-binding protein [Bittarella massiliensis (ex Durand et al. 2017)]